MTPDRDAMIDAQEHPNAPDKPEPYRDDAGSLVVMISNQGYESSVKLLQSALTQAHAEGYLKALEDVATKIESYRWNDKKAGLVNRIRALGNGEKKE